MKLPVYLNHHSQWRGLLSCSKLKAGWWSTLHVCTREEGGTRRSGHTGAQLRQQHFSEGCCVFICASGKRRDTASAQIRPGCPAGSCCQTLIVGFWQIMHGMEPEAPGLAVLRHFYHTCRNFYTMPGVPSTRPGKRGFTNKLELDESNPHATLPPGTFILTWPAGEALTETPGQQAENTWKSVQQWHK